jgi:hypothetical protein
MATSPAAPAPAAPAAADAPANPHKRKNKGKGGGNPHKKKKLLKGPDDRRRRNKPSAKFLKLLEKRARDYNSDDEDDVKVQRQPRRLQPRPPKRRDGAGAGDAAPDEAEADAPSSEEEASSSGGESDDGEKVVTRFEEGCRAFRVAFTKIMSKRLADDPLVSYCSPLNSPCFHISVTLHSAMSGPDTCILLLSGSNPVGAQEIGRRQAGRGGGRAQVQGRRPQGEAHCMVYA